ncbi:hypothetical protein AA0472_2660 [Acetobacter estunensis NRIC 0472]|nr:hypothetical protein AA0472_2660 [Acetobacter estunensis NRIC 0472]
MCMAGQLGAKVVSSSPLHPTSHRGRESAMATPANRIRGNLRFGEDRCADGREKREHRDENRIMRQSRLA